MKIRLAIPRTRVAAASGALACALLAAAGCGGDDSADLDGGTTADGAAQPDASGAECIGDQRPTAYIYFGTPSPSYVPLAPGQVMAVGFFEHCTGTLIAPSWVLTAGHCDIDTSHSFCIGPDPSDPSTCFSVVATNDNPSRDITLVDLGEDVTETVPDVIPIPIMTELMDASWLGTTAEAAGYGEQEDGGYGEREFVAEPIAHLDTEFMTIDGQGSSGACYGDSGGPVMVIATDGTVRVAGELNGGDTNCLGEDNYTRTDTSVQWIEGITGPTVVSEGPYPCGSVTAKGRCMAGGAVAMWCGEEGDLETETCSGDTTCGWDTATEGFRCIAGEDPCGGVDEFGACVDGIARWCEDGVPKFRDCPSCEEICVFDSAHGGAWCAPDACGGLDYLGACVDNVATWCQGGEIQEVDCSESGETCQYIDDEIGYFCD